MSPLKSGKSQDTISKNVQELLRTYKRTGKIGRITPKNMAHAQRVANAIARDKAGLPKTKGKSKRGK